MSSLTVLDIYQNYYSYDEIVAQETRKAIKLIKPDRDLLPLSQVVKMFEDEIDKKKSQLKSWELHHLDLLKKLEVVEDTLGRHFKPYFEMGQINLTFIRQRLNEVEREMTAVYKNEERIEAIQKSLDSSIRKLAVLKCGLAKAEELRNTEQKKYVKDIELERKELELKDLERRELERKELERRELERKDLERKELERKELERKDLERKELERKELEQKDLERKEEKLKYDLDTLIYERTSQAKIAEIAENRIKENLNRGKPKIIKNSLSFNNRSEKHPMDPRQWD
jgi:hypothetical protein